MSCLPQSERSGSCDSPQPIRSNHRPVGPDRQRAVCSEPFPCNPAILLDELALGEEQARRQHEQVMVLREHIEELEGKIRRASWRIRRS
jgi:hypothetical protein